MEIEDYTTERTIAFLTIGDGHYIRQDLARAIAADLESKVKRIAKLEAENKLCVATLEAIAGVGDPDFPTDDWQGEAERSMDIYMWMRLMAQLTLKEIND